MFFFINFPFKSYNQDFVKIDSLQKVLSTQKEDTNKINNLSSLIMSLLNRGDTNNTAYLNEIFRLSQQLDFTPGIADYYYLKANIFYNKRNLDSALFYSANALNLLDSVDDFKRQANYLRFFGRIQRDQGHPSTARIYFNKSLLLYEKLNDENGIAKTYGSLGILLENEMQYDSALRYYFKYLAIAEKNDNTVGQLASFINIGKVLYRLMDYESAIKFFTKCLDLSLIERNHSYIARAYQNLGMVNYRKNKTEVALKLYGNAIAYFDSIPSQWEIGQCLMSIGVIYRDQKNNKAAMQQFIKSEAIFRSIPSIEDLIINLIDIALIHEDNGDYFKTLQIYDSCLAMAKTSNNIKNLPLLYYNISKTHELSGNWKQAFQYQMLHYKLKDSIFSIENRRSMKDLELAYEKEKDEAKIISLQNENLQKDLTIKARTNQRNINLFVGALVFIAGVMLFFVLSIRSRKNRTILEQKIRQMEDEKKLMIAQSLIEGQEQERKRIASELHDGIGVLLSTARLHFMNIVDKDPEHKEMMDKANKLMEQAARDVRKISHNMMPGLLTQLGLVEAVEDLFDSFENNPDISGNVVIKGTPVRLKENTEIMLYRVIQELLNNTVKHSGAKNISLNIHFGDNLKFQYSDDGQGFEVEKQLKKDSFGLSSIISRVGFLRGDITLESKPGKGFTAFIEIPIASKVVDSDKTQEYL